MSVGMKAFVSCIRQNGDGGSADYFLVTEAKDGLETRRLKSKLVLKVGEFIDISVKDGCVESAAPLEGAKHSAAFAKKMAALAQEIPKGKEYRTGMEKVDLITSALWKRLAGAMALL